jgi:anti-sigma factor ChrR (cupin superfamily)
MTRDHKHPNADQLASLAAGALRPRRAASIQARVAECEQCTWGSQQLNAIPAILASATCPPMADNLSARIESVLSHEARQRHAAMPATEAGRRDLPARRPRAGTGGGWRLPGLPGAATRLAAVVSAVVIAAAGSYLVAENVGTSVTRSPSSPPAGAAAPAQKMTPGPEVTYGQPGSRHTIRAVESHTN